MKNFVKKCLKKILSSNKSNSISNKNKSATKVLTTNSCAGNQNYQDKNNLDNYSNGIYYDTEHLITKNHNNSENCCHEVCTEHSIVESHNKSDDCCHGVCTEHSIVESHNSLDIYSHGIYDGTEHSIS